MQVNVSQLLQDPIGSRRRYDFAEVTEEGGRVSGTADLMRTDAGILVTATCDADIRHTCDRCLSPFFSRAHFRFDEEFFPVVDVLTGARLTAPEEDHFTIDERHTLDLSDAVRQYVILEQPLRTLCRTDCRGLCPQCGANLNEVSCSCPPPAANPKWERLRELWNMAETSR